MHMSRVDEKEVQLQGSRSEADLSSGGAGLLKNRKDQCCWIQEFDFRSTYSCKNVIFQAQVIRCSPDYPTLCLISLLLLTPCFSVAHL